MVCQETDLKDGQMKEVMVGEKKVLLVCSQGQYSAIGSQCSHYNAPLVKGTLVGQRVRCPFHGACFNVRTGDIEEYPGLDSLPTYKVKVENGMVYVTVNKHLTKRVKEMCSRIADIKHTILLIGGGPAALVCAETLRQTCYEGRIIMVTRDALPPFDKPKLSKVRTEEKHTRMSDFYQQYGIEVWTEKEVISVNTVNKAVKMIDGTWLNYDQLLIATGCRARPLSCPGWDLKGVKLLQTHDDMFEEQNVKFYMNDGVTEIRGNSGKVKEVVLKSGTILEADVVVAGIVCLSTNFPVTTVHFMKTNVPDIFSAGDVTSFPLSICGDKMVNIGHWQMSQAQGRVAALNMLKKPTEFQSVPFFWTVLLGKSIRYTGYGEGYTEIIYKGSIQERKFLAFYIKEEKVVAAASLMFDPAVARLAELMASGQTITKTQAQAPDLAWLLM
uniref:Apoptosis inducing factor mitochondria associated 4 n=1 Tax=Takifugu rubripes TaxID=31033 RepID=H2UUI7_TAKRU